MSVIGLPVESIASDLKLYCAKGVYVKSPALVPTQFPEPSSHRQSGRLKGDVDGLAGLHRLEQHKLQLEAGCALSGAKPRGSTRPRRAILMPIHWGKGLAVAVI